HNQCGREQHDALVHPPYQPQRRDPSDVRADRELGAPPRPQPGRQHRPVAPKGPLMSPIPHNVIAATTVALLAGAAALIAGPLTPPGGPVGPTYKTLSEVQPARPVQSLA